MSAFPRRVVIGLFLIVLFGVAAFTALTLPSAATSGQQVQVIVQLKGEPAAVRAARARQQGGELSPEQLQALRTGLRAEQDAFLSSLAARGVNASLASRDVKGYDGAVAGRLDLRYTLVFNGFVLNVPSASVSALKAMPEVKDVQPNGLLYTQLGHSVDYIGAPKVYGAVKELTQFDDLREGYEGQGINIAVIDTGIDWTHPMFGGDPTPPRLGVAPAAAAANTNQKVIYHLPLTDTPVGDGFGHGTHVASTAAGYLARHPGSDGLPNTADDVNLHGVAPQAKLLSYTVCSTVVSTASQVQPLGGCEQANTIMALEDAVSPFTVTGQPKPVAHVINLSLGGAGGPDSATAVACSNAALTGATVVASSGNSGPGEGTTGAPAAGTHVISVGANTHPGAAGSQWSADLLQASAFPASRTGAVTPANGFAAAGGYGRVKLFAMSGTAGLPAGAMAQRYTFVNLPLGTWPASVSGRIALVKDALGATIFDIVAQAYNAGAVGVILFDDRGAVNGVRTLIPAATISPADGEILVDALSSTDDNNVDPPNGAVSELPVRMNPYFSDTFMGEMGDFSSRGPVRGFGQVKPDVSAPGVAVLAAVPPASVLGGLAAALEATPNYMHLDGTSMSSPHTAGAVALIKQAHPDWSPDMIRTALINTATNMRNQTGQAKAEGLTADSVIAQGGGLVDVPKALRAKALMGVEGDGINTPAILGSHSYGEVPVINSRTTHTAPVQVTIRDLSGQGGTYDLAVANNRDLQLAGISVSTSETTVSVPAGGEATFTVNATVDGDLLRSVMAAKTAGTQVLFERIQMQWYVTAARADGGQSLRMPFYFRPAASLPVEPEEDPQQFTGIMVAGDAGLNTVNGATFVEHPFDVSASTYKLDAKLEWISQEAQDMDFYLVDPSGNVIATSGVLGGPEQFSAALEQPGTYKYRVVGFANGPLPYTITGKLYSGPDAPGVNTITGEYADAGGQTDFDGNFTVSWQPAGGERRFEVERSSDGGQNWELVASPEAGTTSLALTGQPNGTHSFRVRGLHDGRVGFYVTPAGAAQSIRVDRRTAADITSIIQAVNKAVTFGAGTTDLDQALRNKSASTTVYPTVSFEITSVQSSSGQVAVSNADNGGDGKNAPAAFSYSAQLAGGDLTPGEESGARRLRFSNPNTELFTFTAVVRGHLRDAVGTTSGGGTSGTSTGGTSGGGDTSGGLQSTTQKVLTFTVNPLTKSVSVTLGALR